MARRWGKFLMPYGIVYLVINRINGKRYVGQTTQSLNMRWSQHVYAAFNRPHEIILHNAIRKYGAESFSISQIAEASDKALLDWLEDWWMLVYSTLAKTHGYNRKTGGSSGQHTSETRQRLSARAKGRRAWNKDKPMSETQKEKLRTSCKGRVSGFRGHKHTTSAIAANSLAAKLRTQSHGSDGRFISKGDF